MLQDILDLLVSAITSKTGTMIAAAVLSLMVWLLTKVKVVSDFIAGSSRLTKVVTLFLAVVPAVILSLTSKASWLDASLTAVLTFFGALGVSDVVSSLKPKTQG